MKSYPLSQPFIINILLTSSFSVNTVSYGTSFSSTRIQTRLVRNNKVIFSIEAYVAKNFTFWYFQIQGGYLSVDLSFLSILMCFILLAPVLDIFRTATVVEDIICIFQLGSPRRLWAGSSRTNETALGEHGGLGRGASVNRGPGFWSGSRRLIAVELTSN